MKETGKIAKTRTRKNLVPLGSCIHVLPLWVQSRVSDSKEKTAKMVITYKIFVQNL